MVYECVFDIKMIENLILQFNFEDHTTFINNLWRVTMKKITVLLWLLLLFFSCSSLFDTSYDVEYKVTGSASKVDITIENEDGGTSQYHDVPVPWSYTFKGEVGDFVYVSAQNQGQSGTVTATIYRDGETFKTSTSSGAYVIATASGSL